MFNWFRPGRFLLILAIFCAPMLAHAQSESNPDFVPNRVIVKLKKSPGARALQSLQAVAKVAKSRRLALIDAEVWDLNGQTTEQAIAALKAQPAIEYVEPDYIVRVGTPVKQSQASRVIPNDVQFGNLWGLDNNGQNGGADDADIDAPEAWAITTGKPIIVGVIDSGTDWQHEDLAANIWSNPNEIPGNGIDDDENGYIDDVRGWDFFENDNDPMDGVGHGTHVAGTIAAVGNNKNGAVGVNWAARLMILRFLGPDGSGSTSGAISAIEYAVKMKAQLTNNSWGGGQSSQALQEAIAAAGAAGQLFVAAAGNTGSDSDLSPQYPASYDLDNILSVANTTRFDLLASSSTYGAKTVDLAAPGSTILSTLPGNDYGNLTGTSMASPHVAGVASLMLSIDPSLSPVVLKNLLMSTVDTLKALSGKVVTGGRLNAFKAISAADPDTAPPAAIADLQAGDPASNELVLRWTASGDDGTAGSAAAYQIRYSADPIDENNFEHALLAPDPPLPQPGGAPEQYVLSGLQHSLLYYVAIRVIDNVGNASAISNVASAVTLGAPQIAVTQDSLKAELLTGAELMLPMTISNQAEGTLDFELLLLGQNLNWIRVEPEKGRVFANDSATASVLLNASGLNAGRYLAEVQITSNDPVTVSLTVPVHMQVIGAPDILVRKTSIEFGEVFVGERDSTQLVVVNIGTDSLRINDIQVQPGNFEVAPAGVVILPGDSALFNLYFSPSGESDFSGTLTISSNDPDEQNLVIVLNGRGVLPPALSLSPDSLDVTLLTGQVDTQTFALANTGGSELRYFLEVVESAGAAHAIQRASEAQIPQYFASGSDILPDVAPQIQASNTGSAVAAILPFRDGFESGDFSQWLIDDISGVREVTNSTAARGQYSFAYSNLIEGHFHGIHQEFEASQPEYISFYIRSGSSTQSDAYFLLTNGGETRNSVILFFARANGFLFANGSTPGGDESFRYQANQWYKIEFKDLNWQEKHFDYYVDGVLIKAAIPFRNADFVNDADRAYLYNFSVNSRAWWDNIIIGDPGTLWLDASPVSGAVAARSQAEIEVTLNASGLQEKTYRAALEIVSNDPLQPRVTMPVTMRVSDAPDVTFSTDSLHFGNVYVGVTVSDSLQISNQGTDTLRIADMRVDSPDFRIEPISLELPPAASGIVRVHFTASARGVVNAILTVTSNDPDEAEAQIRLAGYALVPPEIAITPDSLRRSLFTGESANVTLSVRNPNTEADTLRFDLNAISSNRSATVSMATDNASDPVERAKWSAKHAEAWQQADRIGVEAVTVAQSNPHASAALPIVLSDAQGDGDVVDVVAVRALSGDEYIDFQIDFATTININDFGGAISLDLDQNPDTGLPPTFGNPQQDIGAEYELFFFNLRTNLVQLMRGSTLIANYPLQIDTHTLRFSVALIHLNRDDGILNLSGALGPATKPSDWFPETGHGTVLKSASWLAPATLSAEVPGGEQLDIEFEFRAAGLSGGEYRADILFASNDPFTPMTATPARLRVTAAPDIAISDSSFDFGEVFIGFEGRDSLMISNVGSDELLVSGIASDHPDFVVPADAFALQPGEQRRLPVRYIPSTEGVHQAKLVLSSNDPDEPEIGLALLGQSQLPPVIAVEPAELSLLLSPGKVYECKLIIRNQGASPLRFTIRDEEQEVASFAPGGNLFWNVNSNVAEDTLYRSTLEGDDQRDLFLEVGLSGIAADEKNELLYRAIFDDGSLRESRFDGSESRVILSGLSGPVAIDVDAANGKIYWADFVANVIARANLDGSGFEVIAAGQANGGKANLADVAAGPAAQRSAPDAQALAQPWGLAIDHSNAKIYWTEQSGNRVARANLDGSAEETLFALKDSLDGPRGIVVDPGVGKLFFIDSFNGKIRQANLNGSGLETIYQFEANENALSLAIDRMARKLYWTTNGTDLVQRMNYDGSDVEILAQTNVVGYVGPFGIAVAPRTGWLSETPGSAAIEAGQNLEVLVEIDAVALAKGDYEATIFIHSNDPATPEWQVPVSLRLDETMVALSMPDSLHTIPGDSISVPISIDLSDSVQAINALGAALAAEGNVLHFLGSTPGPVLTDQTLNVFAPEPDSVRMAMLALGQKPLSQSGILATLHFLVDSMALGGEYAFRFSDLSANTVAGQGIVVSGSAGSVFVRTHSIAGSAFYSNLDGSADSNRPVPELDVRLRAKNRQAFLRNTDEFGHYQLAELRPGDDYIVEIGRTRGGLDASLTPTDALLIVQAFLGNISFSGAQKLAADADGNHTINPIDAGLIFNRFLGRIEQFPTADWRAFPSEFQLEDSLDNWKKALGRRDHFAVQENLINQNFHAVAVGDVDLSWPNAAPEGATGLLAKGGAAEPLVLRIKPTTISPENVESVIEILIDGPALDNGVYALGGTLEFDGTALEVVQVCWHEQVATNGFRFDHSLQNIPQHQNNEAENEAAKACLRFGAFSVSSSHISHPGTLLEVVVRLKKTLEPGTSLPLHLQQLTAVQSFSSQSTSGGSQGGKSVFSAAKVFAEPSAIQIAALPKRFALAPNYPNPFNPTTRIRYQLSETAHVELAVFDALGRRVQTLVDRTQAAGFYAIEWNGRDQHGQAVASGVYLLRIEATGANESFSKTQKMLLMK
ncbi:MAG: S8 family serine peptidase [Deferribacteres bacterium]|nr:S8 family serine peptidase [Deferribacteres bacterium]